MYGCTIRTLMKRMDKKLDKNGRKNSAYCFAQILEAAPHKTTAARDLPPIFKKNPSKTRHGGSCWRSKKELISDVFLWTLTHGCANVGLTSIRSVRTLNAV